MGTSKIERVEDMPVFQLFYKLALDVEIATRHYGPDFHWLRIQILRSSESVPANMTEGFYAQYSTEYLQSLYRCRREARETMTHLNYAKDVDKLQMKAGNNFIARYEDGMHQLSNLIVSIERKIQSRGKSKPTINHKPSTINHS